MERLLPEEQARVQLCSQNHRPTLGLSPGIYNAILIVVLMLGWHREWGSRFSESRLMWTTWFLEQWFQVGQQNVVEHLARRLWNLKSCCCCWCLMWSNITTKLQVSRFVEKHGRWQAGARAVVIRARRRLKKLLMPYCLQSLMVVTTRRVFVKSRRSAPLAFQLVTLHATETKTEH